MTQLPISSKNCHKTDVGWNGAPLQHDYFTRTSHKIFAARAMVPKSGAHTTSDMHLIIDKRHKRLNFVSEIYQVAFMLRAKYTSRVAYASRFALLQVTCTSRESILGTKQ